MSNPMETSEPNKGMESSISFVRRHRQRRMPVEGPYPSPPSPWIKRSLALYIKMLNLEWASCFKTGVMRPKRRILASTRVSTAIRCPWRGQQPPVHRHWPQTPRRSIKEQIRILIVRWISSLVTRLSMIRKITKKTLNSLIKCRKWCSLRKAILAVLLCLYKVMQLKLSRAMMRA